MLRFELSPNTHFVRVAQAILVLSKRVKLRTKLCSYKSWRCGSHVCTIAFEHAPPVKETWKKRGCWENDDHFQEPIPDA
jgi:hypothetical protein